MSGPSKSASQTLSDRNNASQLIPAIFAIAGFESRKAQWISGLNQIFYMSATLICVFTSDHIGRCQAVAMFIVDGLARGGLNANADGDLWAAGKWGAAAASMAFSYTFIFAANWLILAWPYLAKVFPLQVRVKGNAWSVVGWGIGSGFVAPHSPALVYFDGQSSRSLTLALPYLVSAINEKTMSVFGACNVISIPSRTTEHMDLGFAADTPNAVVDAETKYANARDAEHEETV
ncbi:putative sugar transporter STL1 [Macrophomina phaseolina]|uniref:Sugar transporter STL1 n=1 Tax=Macrophomina phaseolina TaxID=35725 RepID=A0ABQ8G904_9PEZI|nr:putative sugar transporter STL1 [Macrophomina phaseolina]